MLNSLIDVAKEHLHKQQFHHARDCIATFLETHPPESEALYIDAVCCRYMQCIDEALEILAELKKLNPVYARAFQEEGHIYFSQRQYQSAIQAFLQAVSLNPALIASWKNLITLADKVNDIALNKKAYSHYQYLVALPRELLSATSMMYEGQLFKAEKLCRFFMQNNPQHIEGMRILATLCIKNDVLLDAQFILESAVVFDPNHQLARLDYVNILYKLQKYDASFKHATKLYKADPDNSTFRITYANQCAAVGKFDEALILYEQEIKSTPHNPMLALSQGHALKTVGNTHDAIAAYRHAYSVKSGFGDAYWSLANLKTYQFTEAEIEAMRKHEENSQCDIEDKVHLCFALGKSAEDQTRYDEAFQYYEKGNSLRRHQLSYDYEIMQKRLRKQHHFFNEQYFSSVVGKGHPATDPIFIVGLPRAGSTLLEQILSSHSQVDATMELNHITSFAQRMNARRQSPDDAGYPDKLADMDERALRKMGEAYINETQIHRHGAPFFIDKMPNNFRHIGLILSILPNAKIIDARRDPMSCCFSGFKQLFASGQEFTYGLKEIGEYYCDYVELMEHWDKLLPGKILRIHYEGVVSNLEIQTNKILDYCGLSFEHSCLEFYNSKRAIHTPSAEQVRQPIYQKELEHWKYFEKHLQPLKDIFSARLKDV